MDRTDIAFTSATRIEAEGAHVGLVSCRECGAALVLDPRDQGSVLELHQDWHIKVDRILRSGAR